MKPINNWNEIKPIGTPIGAGAYVCKIIGAEVKNYDSRDGGSFAKLEIAIDVAEGNYTGYFQEEYDRQKQEDKRWKGVLRQYIPKDDGSQKDEWTRSAFKSMIMAVEDSNEGYHFDWDEKKMKGKKVGCILRMEEWEMGDRHGWTARPFHFIPVEKLRAGEWKMPDSKPLINRNYDAPPMDNSPAFSDDEVPF